MQGSTTVRLARTTVTSVTENQVTDHVYRSLLADEGGCIVTANVDIIRRAAHDEGAQQVVDAADVVVADGMPLVWAARLSGRDLPERVTGASLFWRLSDAAARAGRSVFIIGGPPGAAQTAGQRLLETVPGLELAGTACPPVGFESSETELRHLCQQVIESKPGLVLVGLGFPKQEFVAACLREQLPGTWFLGCGAAVVFASGSTPRAPAWMQRTGLEWFHRLAHEPRRLTGRYLRDDVPFALGLLLVAIRQRARLHAGSLPS